MATKEKMMYTQEGYNELVEELNFRKTTRREEIREQIATAKSFGDLSENAEYDEARSEQAKNEARILELTQLIENAEIVDETKIDTSVVSLGSAVVLNKNGKTVNYSIVGSNEANPIEGKISDQSPVGKSLMGKREGDSFDVETPAGIAHIEILNVTRNIKHN